MFLFTMNVLDAVVLSIFGIGLGLLALLCMLGWLYEKFIEIRDKFKKKDES
jgi:hypothetical protein